MTQRIALVTGGSRGLGKNARLSWRTKERIFSLLTTVNSRRRGMSSLKLSKQAGKRRQFN